MYFAIQNLRPALRPASLAVSAFLIASVPAQADKKHDDEFLTSYKLSDYGVVPMVDVIEHLNQDVGGVIMKVKLDRKKNPWDWKYKSKVLLPNGGVAKIELDAQSLEILKFKIKS